MDTPIKSRNPVERAVRYGLLQDWYGRERAATEIAAHTGYAENLSETVDRLIRGFGEDEISQYVRLTGSWENYCGEALKEYLIPNGIRDGVLTLTVPHSGLLSLVSPSIELIHARIKEDFGSDFCKEIRVVSGSRRKRNRGTA